MDQTTAHQSIASGVKAKAEAAHHVANSAEAANAAAIAAADALIAPPVRAKRGFAVLSPEKKR